MLSSALHANESAHLSSALHAHESAHLSSGAVRTRERPPRARVRPGPRTAAAALLLPSWPRPCPPPLVLVLELAEAVPSVSLRIRPPNTAPCAVVVSRGTGEPCFDKLEAKLAHGMMSLPATKGFEIGSGFDGKL